MEVLTFTSTKTKLKSPHKATRKVRQRKPQTVLGKILMRLRICSRTGHGPGLIFDKPVRRRRRFVWFLIAD